MSAIAYRVESSFPLIGPLLPGAAAKHHLAAASADDEGDADGTARHAFQAFRHQLNAVQYAEIAVMDNDSLDDESDDEEDSNI